MIRGKGTQVARGILVLLFAAGSASAAPTFPVCLRGAGTLPWMTDSPIFDTVFIDAHSRDTKSSAQETLLVSLPQDQTGMITVSGLGPLPTGVQETPVGSDRDNGNAGFHGTMCQIPSPGTLLLGALGAFLVGALRMRRML